MASIERDSFMLTIERLDEEGHIEAVIEWHGERRTLTDFRPLGDPYGPFPVGAVIEVPVSGFDLCLDHFAVRSAPPGYPPPTMYGDRVPITPPPIGDR